MDVQLVRYPEERGRVTRVIYPDELKPDSQGRETYRDADREMGWEPAMRYRVEWERKVRPVVTTIRADRVRELGDVAPLVDALVDMLTFDQTDSEYA